MSKIELQQQLSGLNIKLRDLKSLYSSGLMGNAMYRYQSELIEHERHLIEQAILENDVLEWEKRAMGVRVRQPDEVETELVKNIILSVLKKNLGATQDHNRDGYRAALGIFIPREHIVSGTTKQTIAHLHRLRNGLVKLIDETIQEIREKNGKNPD